MIKVRKLWFNGGIAGILLSVLLIISSCSDNQVLNSTSDQQLMKDLEAINAVDLAREQVTGDPVLAKPEGDTYLIAKTEYGFEISGNAMTASFVLDNNSITIQVPANAYDKSKWGDRLYIYIRAEKWSTSNGDVYYYECTPEGVVFNSPLKLVQPYENRVNGNQNLYWKDLRLNRWVTADTENLVNGYVRFDIGHFSKYAISD